MSVSVPLLTRMGLRWIPRGILVLHGLFVGAAYKAGPGPMGESTAMGGAQWVLPAVSLGMVLLLQGLGALLPGRPQLFNFPSRDRFLRLPRKYQEPVIVLMRSMVDLVAIETSLVLFFAQVVEWRGSVGFQTMGEHAILLILAVGSTPWLVIMLGRLDRAVGEAETAVARDARRA